MSPRLKRVKFAPVDAAWLRMDRPTNTMMITGVMMFDRPLEFARVLETLNTRMLRYDRFRMRLRESPLKLTLPYWEEDPHFDINAHVHRVALPSPGGMTALQELVSDLMSTPLDYNRPLWQYHIVENFDEGGAVVARLHHCIADGLALVQVLLDMTDPGPDVERPAPKKRPARELLANSVVGQVKLGISGMRELAGSVLHEGWETLTHPTHAVELARQGQELVAGWAKQGTDVVAATGKLLLTLPDRKTIFRGDCGVSKRAAWSKPFPLDEVKAIGKRLGGTVNDVLLAAISGALHRYLETAGQPTEGVEINAMVPVSIRQPHEMGQLGNRFGLVILTLPVGTRDPIERIVILKKRMDDIKHSPEAVVAYAVLSAMGVTPVDVERFILDFFAAKTTAVMTNVPGPREPVYLAGGRLTNLMFWVPTASNLGMGISILSYAGTVMVGIATDICLISDPITIAENFNAELRAMRSWIAPETHATSEEAAPIEEAAAVEEVAPVAQEAQPAPEPAEPLAPGHNGKTATPRKPRKKKVVAEVSEPTT